MDDDIFGRNIEQENDELLCDLLNESKVSPVAKNEKPESVRFLRDGKDVTEEIFSNEMVDGVKVLESGDPAKICIYPSDLNQNLGGCCVVYHKGSWVSWHWDPRCGLT